MTAFYLIIATDALGLAVERAIWETTEDQMRCRAEAWLYRDTRLNAISVDRIEIGRRGKVDFKPAYETRLPF